MNQKIIIIFFPFVEVIMKRFKFSQNKSKCSELPCTFIIKVMHAERNTIQGYIQWLEMEKTIPFRSYMELLHLTQDALQTLEDGSVDFRYWDC